jgi:CSLREA domain-containing protein
LIYTALRMLLLIALLLLLEAAPVYAQPNPIVVNSLADNVVEDGACTLREAILLANEGSTISDCTRPQGNTLVDLINLQALTGTIELASPLPEITDSLSIWGPDANRLAIRRADNAPEFRIFTVGSGIDFGLTNLTLTGGRAASGGALYAEENTRLSLYKVILYANWVTSSGGGVFSLGEMNASNTTLYANYAGSSGGAIYSRGQVTIEGSTFWSNTSASAGGGLYLAGSGVSSITNSTFTDNGTTSAGSAVFVSAGELNLISVTAAYENQATHGDSIANAGGQVSLFNTALAGTCAGTLTSPNGYNFIETIPTNCTIIGNMVGMITGQNPLLAPLDDNSGTTLTMMLRHDSPLRDAGDPTNCVSSAQRNISRYLGGRCDIGAVEYVPPPQFPVAPIWGEEQSSQPTAWLGPWWGTQQYFRGSASVTADLGSGQWVGYFYDCEVRDNLSGVLPSYYCDAPSGQYGSAINTYQTMLFNSTNAPILGPSFPLYDGMTGFPSEGRFGPVSTADINFWFGTNGRPYQDGTGATAPSRFNDTYAARFVRTVSIQPGTYLVQIIANEGARIRISDRTGITINGTPLPQESAQPYGYTNSGLIYNRWAPTGFGDPNVLENVTIHVSMPITNRVMMVEFFEQDQDATLILNATRDAFSFTDSPNTPTGIIGDYTILNSPFNTMTTMTLNGYFDLSGSAAPQLRYYRAWNMAAGTTFTVETSTDGGWSWTAIPSETMTGAGMSLPPYQDWQARTMTLPSASNVRIRFKLDTRGSFTTGDGIYLTDISVIS